MKLRDKRGHCFSLFCEVTMKSMQLLLLVVCGISKWPEVFAIPDQKACSIDIYWLRSSSAIMVSLMNYFLIKERIVCQNWFRFKELGVKKVNTSGYHPQSDGLVEKFNPTLINVIAKYCEKWNHDWDQHLSNLLLHTYCVSLAKSQTESPFYPSF